MQMQRAEQAAFGIDDQQLHDLWCGLHELDAVDRKPVGADAAAASDR